jgi:hypothetical protein
METEKSEVEALIAINDPLLEPLIRTGGAGAEIERLIVAIAQPLTERILSRYVGVASPVRRTDAEDIAATINLRLVAKLRAVTHSPDDAIQGLQKYVSALTYNAINDHLRRHAPERARLKSRLRYALRHDPRLALWTTTQGLACGLSDWRGMQSLLAAVPEQLRSRRMHLDHDQPSSALFDIFRVIQEPIAFDAIVGFFAAVWQISDPFPREASALAHPEISIAERVEIRQVLASLWREIQALRPMQRKALLLNLRDGTKMNIVALLVLTGVARYDDVAAALEMSGEQLASIWHELPLDDLRIGKILNVTRQQVINLRKSARHRLARRVSR